MSVTITDYLEALASLLFVASLCIALGFALRGRLALAWMMLINGIGWESVVLFARLLHL